MSVKTISVEYEKRANDGDYGSELVKVAWHYELQDGEDPCTVTMALQGQIRGRVESDLAQSANLKVRRSLIRQKRTCNRCGEVLPDSETSYMHPACKEAEDVEREARYQERRLEQEERWKQAEASAEAELTRGQAEMRDEDDEADDDEDTPL
jgi:hypothetical protein